jgi:aspartokinase/homoserine dehydrogenase 1
VTTFGGLALLNLEGAAMMGVPGSAERAFAALRDAGASAIIVSQGSSEQSICCVVQQRDLEAGRKALQDAFARELDEGLLSVDVGRDVAALAVVGDGLVGATGSAARLFSALAHAGVNVRAIAQGSSERNISVAIASADATRALRAVHSAFYLSPHAISLGIVGVGNVGKAFARMIESVRPRLLAERGIDLRVRALTNRRHMVLREPALAAAHPALDDLQASTTPTDLDRLVAHVKTDALPHAILVDCTADEKMGDHYADWLHRDIHVITANKHAGSGDYQRYRAIMRAARGPRASFRYTATVGAGLPIIQTLRDLLDTGDQLIAIEGMFSGTLAYIFSRFDGSAPLSTLVREARELGYTEPDPRDDLSGRDVARKLVILSREAGMQLSMSDVALEGLVPEPLRDIPTASFLDRLSEMDTLMNDKLVAARERGMKLRYTASVAADGKPRVGLVELPIGHPFTTSRPTDNIVQFTTHRYRNNPLVVQGPGAGTEVTAAGLVADLLRLCAGLGAS